MYFHTVVKPRTTMPCCVVRDIMSRFFVQNKTTPQRMHNDAWTQSADRASTAAPYITASYNSKQQPTRERDRADTTVSSNPSGCHRQANTRRRTRHEQRGRAQPHQTPQHSITQTINEKLRELIQPKAATLVYSGVCTQLP